MPSMSSLSEGYCRSSLGMTCNHGSELQTPLIQKLLTCIVCKGGTFKTLPSHAELPSIYMHMMPNCFHYQNLKLLVRHAYGSVSAVQPHGVHRAQACAPSAFVHIITADISPIMMSNDSSCGLLPIIMDCAADSLCCCTACAGGRYTKTKISNIDDDAKCYASDWCTCPLYTSRLQIAKDDALHSLMYCVSLIMTYHTINHTVRGLV